MRGGMQELSDEDVVRVCLVVMLEIMFMGRELSQVVTDTVIRAVDDLVTFDNYPWGSHIWSHTYRSLHHATARRHLEKKKNINKSTLNGFAHALKVWILEMFSVCCHHFNSRTDRAIRGTRWDRKIVLNMAACVTIFNSVSDVRHPALERLTPTAVEQQSLWYLSSIAYLEREEARRPTKRSRRRDTDHDDHDEDDDYEDDEDDDDGTGYQAPPSSSHHGASLPDPYQYRWVRYDALHDYVHGSVETRLRELEALIAHLRHTQLATSSAPTYTSPGYEHTSVAYKQTSGG
ncbi:hypothetical protein L6452_20750 [Arctium lappa]|uniref:Uncharacterized protein n=1 Tax=Arctium lappa TaxID=4217 RepID=A0ACB9BGN6_ARCLA|nr:hypothetical protein L6452_20750 [Arctium lappa]